MPKSKELLFLCRNVGTGQRSALLCCLCFSSHLSLFSSPSCFFIILFSLSASLLLSVHTLNLISFSFTSSFPFCSPPQSLAFPCHDLLPSSMCCFSFISFKMFYPSLPLSCSSLSVPAGRCSPLTAAAAAQGQLFPRGDKTGQHPEGVS